MSSQTRNRKTCILNGPDRIRTAEPFSIRNPPLFWRRLCVGTTLMMPGLIAGLTAAVFLPSLLAPYTAFAGAAGGFAVGYRVEGD